MWNIRIGITLDLEESIYAVAWTESVSDEAKSGRDPSPWEVYEEAPEWTGDRKAMRKECSVTEFISSWTLKVRPEPRVKIKSPIGSTQSAVQRI